MNDTLVFENYQPQNIVINGGGSVIGLTTVLVNGEDVTEGSIAYVVVPTKLSELQNDEGFITTETDPTVPYFIKQITISDINRWNNKQDLLVSGTNIKTINDNSILGSGNIEITETPYTAGTGIEINNHEISNTITSYNDLSNLPTIPTKTSDLVNDSDYVVSSSLSQVAFSGSYFDLEDQPVIPQATSQLENDSGFITKEVNDLDNYMLKQYLDLILPKATGSGTSITLDDTVGAELNPILSGNTSQETTSISGGDEYDSPSPDHPQPIHSVTGDKSINVEGKNLLNLDRTLGTPSDTTYVNTTKRTFDYDKYVIGISGNNYYNANNITTYEVANNVVKINTAQSGYGIGFPLKVKASQSYKLSYNISVSSIQNTSVGFYQSDGTYISNTQSLGTDNYLNITTPSNCDFMVVVFRPTQNVEATYSNIMLEYETSSSPYEPYSGNTYPLTLGDLELNKIGDYEDTFIKATNETGLESGKWYLKKNVEKLTFTGAESENWVQLSETNKFYINLNRDLGDYTQMYCNYYTFWYTGQSTLSNGEFTGKGGGGTYLWFRNDSISDVTNYKTWLNTHTNYVYLPLATPTYTLLNDTLQTQLDNIWNMKSKVNQTNISQVNDDLPMVISASTFKTIGG